MPSHPATDNPRFTARLDELRRLAERLARPPGEASASRALELLCAAGELLRRTSATGTEAGAFDGTLQALGPEAIRQGLSAVSGKRIEAALLRASDEAVEAALAEGPEEVELWNTSALEGLRGRDTAESTLAAVSRWMSLGGKLDAAGEALRAELAADLQSLDRKLHPKARWLVGLNEHRRAERDLLDATGRATAWWYASRAECDDLVMLLAGLPARKPEHLPGCIECQRDLERSRAAEEPPSRHITPDDAWRYDLGTMSREEMKAVEAHAEECEACAQVLEALDVGERAIEEQTAEERTAPPKRARPSATEGLSSTRRPGKHIVAAQAEFRVVLVRDPGRVRLLVQPQTSRGIAIAAVSLPPQRSVLKAKPTPEGLEFELGDSASLIGRTARVMVKLTESSPPFERDIEL